MSSRKKENLWHLLKKLDEEAGEFNMHLHHANRYFDSAASHTQRLLDKHEQDLHKTISQLRKALKQFTKKNRNK